jgi:hypothetical protein|nr:MAG TPA: Portal protein [Caudoviricetes sp.]
MKFNIFSKKDGEQSEQPNISEQPGNNSTAEALNRVIEKKPIGEKEVSEASGILRKYREGKMNLEKKIIANEDFFKLRQWNHIESNSNDPKPASAWLFNCIISKMSDVMDSFPEANMLPRAEDDKAEAEMLTSIIPVILEQNEFEKTYSDIAYYTLKNGGGIYGIFWDGSKHNGLGDISIKKIDFINLFWESGITDIQQSTNVFNTELVDNSLLEQRYPELKGKLGGKEITLAQYVYDDTVDTSNKSVVVDWYYHKEMDGRRVLHYCKFVNTNVLFATENEPEKYPNGWYDHGLYPFVVQQLFPVEGSLCGYGYVDIAKDTQEMIDRLNSAILKNALVSCRPRYYIRNDASVNEEEYADLNNDFVHVEGSLSEANIMSINAVGLPGVYVEVRDALIEEMKECTGNRDVSNGGTTSGVTAASAIATMQEQSGKISRNTNRTFYEAFRKVISQCIELIRQFYSIPRQFRIVGEAGMNRYVQYSNANLQPVQQPSIMGVDMGMRMPEFDIEISAQKASPYTKMAQNELALQLYNLGFFNPQMADQALACLKSMDFAHKNDIIQTIQQNGTLLQSLMQFQNIALGLAQQYEPALVNQLVAMAQQSGQPLPTGQVNMDGMSVEDKEHPYVERARDNAQSVVDPEG